MQKRQLSDDSAEDGELKRTKRDYSTALVAVKQTSTALTTIKGATIRNSSLSSPEVCLHGHQGAVYSIAFDPTGENLCSGSMDKNIFLWNISGECNNYNVLSGHKSAVLQVNWSQPNSIVSCSADKTVACWDANRGVRTRKLVEHTSIVNSCSVAKDAPHLIASGSDDCTVILWDSRGKQSLGSIYHDYQVLSTCISNDGQFVYSAGIDNVIRRFDMRTAFKTGRFDEISTPEMVLEGHTDSITGLSLSPDGNHLLSNSMDSTLRFWDVRPFVVRGVGSDSRCEHVASGVHHGAEKLLLRCGWSADQEYVTAGSADRLVHLWDAHSYQQQPSWPGHKASVNDVIFHPTERIIASCSSDKSIILGELDQ